MVNYSQGKVYKLVNTDDDQIYVGSTCGTLHLRKSKHKSNAKICPNRPVYRHLNAIGWDNVRIILLQQISCANKDELRAAEQHYIDMLHPSLNKASAIDTCTHGRIQSQCIDCDGASICQHKRHRASCKDCGGSSICQHKRHRAHCKNCGGVSICEHNLERSRCIECSPFYCDYCQTNHTRGNILRHYRSKKHKTSYIAAYVNAHDEHPTEFPFTQLIH